MVIGEAGCHGLSVRVLVLILDSLHQFSVEQDSATTQRLTLVGRNVLGQTSKIRDVDRLVVVHNVELYYFVELI